MAHLAQATAGVKTRSQTRLNSNVEKNLLAYAAAATAAGIGILTGPSAADAKIIYTPTNQQISGKVPLTFNKGGTVDFYLGTHHTTQGGMGTGTAFRRYFYVQPGSGSAASNEVAATAGGTWGAALKAGAKIGTGGRFTKNSPLGTFRWFRTEFKRVRSEWSGPWVDGGNGVTNRYLGVKFEIKGKYHYGWARMSVTCQKGYHGRFTPTLTGYAYETIANRAIIAGKKKGPDVITVEPGSLGRLAQGSTGLALGRQK